MQMRKAVNRFTETKGIVIAESPEGKLLILSIPPTRPLIPYTRYNDLGIWL